MGTAEKKPRLLVVSQYFYPEPFRINDMAEEWVKRGYEVTVLTGIPNYPQGKFYPGYSFFRRRREIRNGVKIIRIPLTPRGRSPLGMVFNYFSFVFSGWFWSRFTRLRADAVFTFEVSPMTQAKVGVWFAKRRGIPHYLYVQDLWPENVETVTGIHHPLIIAPIDRMVDRIYRDSTEIFVISPSFLESVCGRKKPVPREKVHYWPQYAEEFYRPLPKRPVPEIPDDGAFQIAFTGNIGYAQGLDILPGAARLLRDEPVRFVIVGDGRYKEQLKRETQEISEKFLFLDRQSAERIPEILAACDAAFLSFMDTELFAKTIPAKLQSYMACGMPILAAAKGETERIIREANCGVCCEIGREDALAQAVRTLAASRKIAEMGLNARRYFEAHFDKKTRMDQMDVLFQTREWKDEADEEYHRDRADQE